MPELKPHFQTDPEDEIDNSSKQYIADAKGNQPIAGDYDDVENSEYDSISVPKTTTYNDDEYDY
jgi:hypothetical protein|tara:strand:- start:109 stop:300 length:192 start_codon:yes stop_codon:yes gene_type:complete